MTPEQLEEHVVRLTAAHTELGKLVRTWEDRIHRLETWAQDPSNPLPATGTRLRDLEVRQARLVEEAVARLAQQIREDPQLRELLRGPRGLRGEDGEKGEQGENAATVIREVKISG